MNNKTEQSKISDQNIPGRRHSKILGIIAGLSLVFALIFLYSKIAPDSQKTSEVAARFQAPDFNIVSFQTGESIALSDFSGKGIVLNFWASWCHPCKEEMPALEAAWQKYKDQGVVFIGVNSSDNNERATEFIDEYALTFLNGSDLDGTVSDDYRIQGIPTTWFINGEGLLEKIVYGPLDLEGLDAAISLILPN